MFHLLDTARTKADLLFLIFLDLYKFEAHFEGLSAFNPHFREKYCTIDKFLMIL